MVFVVKRKTDFHLRNSGFVAILINLLFLMVAIIFCDMKYEVSDDFVMDSILSGAYGVDYDSHLLYSNIILGYGLKLLYKLIPVVSWYFVMHIVLCFVSLTIVTYVILNERKDAFGLLLALIFVSFFSDDLYLLVQFTKTAAVCIMAGGTLFLYTFWRMKEKKKSIYYILSVVMCMVGTMVRFSCAYMVLPFLFLIFVYEAFSIIMKHIRNKDWHDIKKVIRYSIVGCVCCVFLFWGAVGIKNLNSNIWSKEEGYKDYSLWNNARASVTDISGFDRDEVIASFEQLDNTTLEDYYTVQSWNIVDQSIYTKERLGQLAQIMHANAEKKNHSVRSIFEVLKGRHYEMYTVIWGIGILVLLFLISRRNKWWIVIADCCVACGLLVYLVYGGRIVYRGEYGIFFCLATLLIWHLIMRGEESLEIDKKQKTMCIVAIVILLIAKIPLYIPDTNYKTMTDEEYNQYVFDVFYESWDFKLSKYRACVNKRPVYADLISLMENDTEHYYLCDFASTIQLLYYHYKPWIRLPIGYYKDTYSYLGGVTTYFPGCYYVWGENGLNPYNPYENITNDNILIVDNYYYYTKVNYYKQYYDENAELNLVQECDGYSIWKIK